MGKVFLVLITIILAIGNTSFARFDVAASKTATQLTPKALGISFQVKVSDLLEAIDKKSGNQTSEKIAAKLTPEQLASELRYQVAANKVNIYAEGSFTTIEIVNSKVKNIFAKINGKPYTFEDFASLCMYAHC